MENLIEKYQRLQLDDDPETPHEQEEPEQLIFRPPNTDDALNNIPHYLFRIVSPKSDGITNDRWVRSVAAVQKPNCPQDDIFFKLDGAKQKQVAHILSRHLWWVEQPRDLFVSWTSSLLFAIQYIYYRHLHEKDGSALEDIKLFIIDTTKFPRGTFMRDLNLIESFWKHDSGLGRLRDLRTRKGYYFGEYLSQGALKVENKCQILPANVLFEKRRLSRIQPEFGEPRLDTTQGGPEWAKAVLRIRSKLLSMTSLHLFSRAQLNDSMQAVVEIIQNVAPAWRYPLAVYLAALIGAKTTTKEEERVGMNHDTTLGSLQTRTFAGE